MVSCSSATKILCEEFGLNPGFCPKGMGQNPSQTNVKLIRKYKYSCSTMNKWLVKNSENEIKNR